MITLLIIWLIKYYRKSKIPLSKSFVPKSLLLLVMVLNSSISAYPQLRISHYNILHDGEIKGTLVTYMKSDGKRMHIKLESEVKTRFIIRITVKSVEEAIFENGILVYSALYRKVNGDEKVNQQLHSSGDTYKITSKDKLAKQPAYPIHYSILSLYMQEPVNIDKVYSDNFGQYVKVRNVDKNKYQVTLPNGNSNYYSYKNGVCTNVLINQFYNLELQLK